MAINIQAVAFAQRGQGNLQGRGQFDRQGGGSRDGQNDRDAGPGGLLYQFVTDA